MRRDGFFRAGVVKRVLAGMVAAGLVVIAAVYGYWWVGFEPLEPVELTALPEGRLLGEAPDRQLWIDYTDGELVSYEFVLRNASETAVTVQAVDPHTTWGHRLLRPVAFALGAYDPEVAVAPEHTVPLRPFRLRAGEEARITVFALMRDCEFFLPGSSTRLEGHIVQYGRFGLRRTQWVPYPTTIVVPSPGPADALGATGDCPRPQPPRDTRTTGARPGFPPERIIVNEREEGG